MAKPNLGDVDKELELALELSRKTFAEEENRRNLVEKDLMMMEDPAERERNFKIEAIKRLYDVPYSQSLNSINFYNNNNNHHFGAIRKLTLQTVIPTSSQNQQQQFELSTSNLNDYQAYKPPPDGEASFFSSPSTIGGQLDLLNSPWNPFLPSTSTGSTSQNQSPLLIDQDKLTNNNDELSQQYFNVSPLKVPFRSFTDGEDLIDLHPIHSTIKHAKSMTLEEFDPLHNKRATNFGNPASTTSKSCSPLADRRVNRSMEEAKAVSPMMEHAVQKSHSTAECTLPSLSAETKKQKSTDRQTLFHCDDVKIVQERSCDFYKDESLLTEKCRKLSESNAGNSVFFLSPMVNYYTTSADSIKLVVHQDDTWRKDTADEPKRFELTCDVRSTAEEILVDILLRLLSPEIISRNGGNIPLNDYALKVYGSDEFLVPTAEIGKHPFVGHYLSQGKDVELEVGKRMISLAAECSRKLENSLIASPIVTEELFRTFHSTLKSHIDKCLLNPQDRKLRQGVLQSLKMLTTFMNNVQPHDLISAIDMFYAETAAEQLRYAAHCIVIALARLLRMYSTSVPTDFTIQPLPDSQTESSRLATRDASACNDKLLISVESLHNLQSAWQSRYKAYFIEAHLMYGPKSYGNAQSTHCALTSKYHFNYVLFSFWAEFDAFIPSLPRESQICFILRGIPHTAENGGGSSDGAASTSSTSGNRNQEMLTAHGIAFASLPLYNFEGFLHQGPLLLPMTEMSDDVVHPWGPRPLVRNAENPVLVVKCVEYDYRIRFPVNLPESKAHWREFKSIPKEDQDNLLAIVDGGIGSHMLSDDDKQLLWSNRDCLHDIPRALPLVLASSFSWGVYSLSNIYLLLKKWSDVPPVVAIELLLPNFQDRVVRERALSYVRNASSEFLFNLLTQFVEALRYETHECSALATFLLEQSTKNRRFAFELYWQLQHRIHDTRNASYSMRCHLLQKLLLDLNIAGFRNEIGHQHFFLEKLDQISRDVKEAAESNMNMILQKELYTLSDTYDFRNIRLPISPGFQCRSIIVEECGYFNSLTKPIKIIMRGRKNNYGVIFKMGDDLRQDAIVLQLVRVMNDIWLNHQLDLRMILFRCLPTGVRRGMIELVPDCCTLREIQTTPGATGVFKDDVLNNWLLRQNQSEFQYKAALENFRRSCAGWCVATYVLGIGDRHNDNILVTTAGHVFHIDFGKYMGDWQMAAGFKRDRVPFVLTADMAYVINGGSQNTTEHFQKFIDDCCKAFNLLRKNCSMLINIIKFMSCSDIPGMNMDSEEFVEGNLMLNLNEVQATTIFTRMIEESLRSKFPRLNFFAHTLAQLRSNPLLFGGRPEDMNCFSFISETYSDKTDARIESVHVCSYEKWHIPEKVYMYKLLIRRVNENVSSQVFRSFAEFQELHWKLCYRFSSKAIPPLTITSAIIGRTNIRAVASRRQVDLENFLQRLFSLSDEVAHSDLVYTFFHTLYRDTEPDAARNQEVTELRYDSYITPPQIHLRLSFNEALAEFRVFVGHAKQLPLIGGREQTPDSYVKTYLRQPYTPQLKHWKRKTLVVKNAQNPTYNEEIVYALGHKTLEDFTTMILEASIWHSGSAVLKDNFQLCELLIPLSCFSGALVDRRGIRTIEKWYPLRLCFT